MDPIKAAVNVQNYLFAVSQQAQTSLRSIIGQSEMDQLLSERESVNRELRRVIDELTEGRGASGSSGWRSRTSRCPRDRDWLDYDDQAAADPAGPVTFSDAHIFLQGAVERRDGVVLSALPNGQLHPRRHGRNRRIPALPARSAEPGPGSDDRPVPGRIHRFPAANGLPSARAHDMTPRIKHPSTRSHRPAACVHDPAIETERSICTRPDRSTDGRRTRITAGRRVIIYRASRA
jgi:hypothetical protein